MVRNHRRHGGPGDDATRGNHPEGRVSLAATSLVRALRGAALALALAGCGRGTGGAPVTAYPTPGRAEQAPEVRVEDIVNAETPIGRRVRVTGTCGLAGTGPSSGVWVLQADGFAIEVRGLVPRSCFPGGDRRRVLTIFAQVEPKAPGSAERLLLRLPD